MCKLKRVCVCNVCGKQGEIEIHFPHPRQFLPDNWGAFGKMDLCDKCYAKIKRILEEGEDASNP